MQKIIVSLFFLIMLTSHGIESLQANPDNTQKKTKNLKRFIENKSDGENYHSIFSEEACRTLYNLNDEKIKNIQLNIDDMQKKIENLKVAIKNEKSRGNYLVDPLLCGRLDYGKYCKLFLKTAFLAVFAGMIMPNQQQHQPGEIFQKNFGG